MRNLPATRDSRHDLGDGEAGRDGSRLSDRHERVSRNRSVRAGNQFNCTMSWNFIECDREQVFLLPPDVRDWLPADHLVWLVL